VLSARAHVAKIVKTKTSASKDRRSGRVAIVGRANVGKSTLLNALLGEPIAIVSRHAQTTRDQILGVVTHGDAQLGFIDTPGLHKARHKLGARMNALARDAAREADVVLFVTDVTSPPRATFSEEDRAILKALPDEVPVVLVLNKIDRVKDKHAMLAVLEGVAKEYDFKSIIPVSALRTDGMDRIITEVSGLLPKGDFLFDGDSLSDKPVRFFVAEFVREQILQKTYQEIPHGIAVAVERFDESGPTYIIELAVHVDREAHKKILIGAKGAMMKAVGTAARARIEAMLGKHVHLQLWVRVTPGWAESEDKLRELGYAPENK
jgi:GTP-binding protein Era